LSASSLPDFFDGGHLLEREGYMKVLALCRPLRRNEMAFEQRARCRGKSGETSSWVMGRSVEFQVQVQAAHSNAETQSARRNAGTDNFLCETLRSLRLCVCIHLAFFLASES